MSVSLAENAFDFCMQLYKALDEVNMSEDNVITGILPSSFNIEDVEDAIGDMYLFNENIDKKNRLINFKVNPNNLFCRTQEDLLSSLLSDGSNYCTVPPEKFFIVEDDYFFSEGTPPPQEGKLGCYFLAIEFISNLHKVADLGIPETKPERLVFIGSSKLYVTTRYSGKELIVLEDLDGFVKEYFSEETHKKQKSEIIKSVLLEIAQGRLQISVGELFKKFKDLKARIENNYALYVSEFSYEKVKDEVVKEKLEAIVSLNKVFSDIQNQLLALPVALLLVRGQLENIGHISVKNFVVWISFSIFSLFMYILVRNQSNTLKAVKSEIDQQKKQLHSKYQAIGDRFNSDFDEIDSRYFRQRIILWIVLLVVVAVFALVSLVSAWYSGFNFAICSIQLIKHTLLNAGLM